MKEINIIATSPVGTSVYFHGALVAAEQAGADHWTLHRESDSALIGLVPKTWTLKWEPPVKG